MPAYLAVFRLKGTNFAQCEGMPFQQHFEARVDRPLDDLDMKEFFRDLQENLRVGDQVTVCAYMRDDWEDLMEIGVCRIIHKAVKEIEAAWTGPIIEVPKPSGKKKAFVNKTQKLYRKKEFGGGFTVQDKEGHVIERFKTKAEADDYISRLNSPTPTPEPLALDDIVQ